MATSFVVVDELETLEPVHHPGLGDTDDPGTADIAAGPGFALGHLVFKRRVSSNPTILINQETTVIGYQIVALDDHPDVTVLVMPITPGSVYRWWIGSFQYCQVGGPDGRARTSRSTSGRCFSPSPNSDRTCSSMDSVPG
jgi:hypothetical protein